MHGFFGMRARKAVIFSILVFALVATLAACGGAGSAKGSGSSGTSTHASGCKNRTPNSLDGADDIAFGLAGTNIIAGHIRYLFGLTNENSSPCTFEGYPTITLNQSSITVTTTASASTWSNIAIKPITLAPNNGTAWFALQGYDQKTNCQLVTPTVALPQETKGVTSDSPIYVCGGKLYVSPLVNGPEEFGK